MLSKRRIYEIMEIAKENDGASRAFNIFMMSLITLSIGAVILETVKSVESQFVHFFRIFDQISLVLFSAEYLLRLWSATSNPRFAHPVWGRVRYIFTPLALIDLIAILPFYLPFFLPFDLRVMRAFRLFRLLRVLKLTRYSESMRVLGNVVRAKREELFICIFIGLVFLVIASSLMYFIEHEVQPDRFPNIPAAMWWGVVTLTTVGYGDVYPITPLGRIIGGMVAVLGIGMFALPAGILASGFADEIRRVRVIVCPHCGMEITSDH
jgi:voltage-gated potassium channel